MGCFFACFRIKDDDRRKTHLVSNLVTSKCRDPVVSKNQLASVFLCEEKDSPYEQAVDPSSQGSIGKDGVDGELKHEANFLKSIGTLPGTPAEFRKASEIFFVQTTNGDGLSPNSSLTDTSHKKLDWDKPLGKISDSPSQVNGNLCLQEHKLEGCNSEEPRTLSKVMRIEGRVDESGVESVLEDVSLNLSPNKNAYMDPIASNNSPYPTPINLADEMQTPGTIYPASLESPRTGKNVRIRTQYVYPVLNPVENLTQWNELRENSCQLAQSSDLFEKQMRICNTDGREKIEQILVTPVQKDSGLHSSLGLPFPVDKKSQNQETISNEESPNEKGSSNMAAPLDCREQQHLNSEFIVSSLSHWLKPPLLKDDKRNIMNITKERSHSGKSSDVDRPIIGLVATHWNDNEPSLISDKWWDGKGIPNSTNKYKEDQKVSWHATPFEERLEKALSDETLFPQRKLLNGKPIKFDEGEESDTAAS